MTLDEAIRQACDTVGIIPPRIIKRGTWMKTNTLSGKNGIGDGRLIVNELTVTAWNWQTGTKESVHLKDKFTEADRRKFAADMAKAEKAKRQKHADAAILAQRLVAAATLQQHPYLVAKGFPDEKMLVVNSDTVSGIVEWRDYLIPQGGRQAVLVPARLGSKVSSVQLIWEDGTKKFLYGGEIGGACHRIASGHDTWLCEGFATGLSIRAGLRGLRMQATVLCCFSAANIVMVAKQARDGRAFIAADNDKPLPEFGGLGTGEHYARVTGLPYGMPANVCTDFNDVHQSDGIFAVQKALTSIMAGRRAA